MLKHRLTYGVLLIAALIAMLWADQWLQEVLGYPALLLLPVAAIIVVLASHEVGGIFRAHGIPTPSWFLAVAALLGLAISAATPDDLGSLSGAAFGDGLGAISGVAIAGTVAAIVLIASMIYYTRHHTTEGVVAAVASTMLCFVYIGLMGGMLVAIRKEHSAWWLLGVLAIAKSCDIGAYFTGTLIGKHKLIPWLSPGKTWEGLIGGMAASAGVGVLATTFVPHAPHWQDPYWWEGLLLGAALGLVGQAGDLVASVFKRDAGIKDYAATLPGFGGVMDIIDSPLLVAPVAYWILKVI